MLGGGVGWGEGGGGGRGAFGTVLPACVSKLSTPPGRDFSVVAFQIMAIQHTGQEDMLLQWQLQDVIPKKTEDKVLATRFVRLVQG